MGWEPQRERAEQRSASDIQIVSSTLTPPAQGSAVKARTGVVSLQSLFSLLFVCFFLVFFTTIIFYVVCHYTTNILYTSPFCWLEVLNKQQTFFKLKHVPVTAEGWWHIIPHSPHTCCTKVSRIELGLSSYPTFPVTRMQ